MLEVSARHVGKRSMCTRGMLGCRGLPSLPREGGSRKRVSSRQRGTCEKAERGFGVWSFVFMKEGSWF